MLHAKSPSQWQFITYEEKLGEAALQRWMLAAANGRPVVCEVSDIVSQHMAARTGVGVTALPRFLADKDATLQRLPFEDAEFEPEIWLVLHADLQNSPVIRRDRFCSECHRTVSGTAALKHLWMILAQ